jgi:non-ribosomal peptide synthase protein (TIGR01720 family)
MLVNAYGPTESTTCLLNVGRHGHQVERHTFPLGYPVDRTEVTLVNEAGIQEAVYGIGEIRIQSEYVALGYWRRDDLTREKFIQSAKGDNNIRSYCTGDIGRWLPDGRIEFVGRRDFQVKIRGYRVELGEIEAVLAKHPGIQDAVAVAKRADPDQYRLVAYYVSKDNVWIAPGELREYMSGLLPDFMVPALCLELGQLSLTPTRKIDRRSLPEPDWSVLIESRLYEPPKDATERLFVELWAELLGLEPDRIGVEDDFFELGGDSLLCLRCLSRARARGIVIAPSQFIKLRTIRRIAEVANTSVAESAAAEDSFFSNVVPLLPTQVYVTSCANPHFFNGAIMLKPLGQLSAECVKSAFMIVINYHEGLRQKFVNEQEGWQSIISEPLEQFDLDYLDLRSVREDEQEKAFERYAENRQPGFDLSRPPLIRATIVDYGSGKQRLFILYHTLLMDLYGQLIFLEDFVQAYEQLLNGEPVRLAPKSASYPSWTGRMKAFASQEQTLKEMEYWTALPWSELAEPWPDVPEQYPAGFPNNRMLPRFPDVHKETVALDMSQTGILLKRLPRQHGVQIDDILLSAYAYAISNWTGGTAVLFDYIVSGRILPIADLDISRTIGPAACSIPVVMRIGESDPIAALLSASKQLQAIPNEKIGFHIFRQYSVDEEARSILNAFPLPNFSFKYNGGFDKREPLKGLFDYSNEKTGESGSREHLQKHRYLIRTNTGLSEDGTFTADFIYNANLLNADTVRSVAQSFIERLRLLCSSEVDGAIMNDDRMGGRRG